MFCCSSTKPIKKDLELRNKAYPKILMKINNKEITFDPIESNFLIKNDINEIPLNDEAEMLNRLNQKKEKINLFKKKIEDLDKKLRFVEKIARQDQEELMIYEDLYNDQSKKIIS
jgi:hypothetical protein